MPNIKTCKKGGKRISGTKEWAAHNLNIVQGCGHRCRYCYARAMAHRFGRIKSFDVGRRLQSRPKAACSGLAEDK